MHQSAEAAREEARRNDGKFGHQQHSESRVNLLDDVQGPPDDLWKALDQPHIHRVNENVELARQMGVFAATVKRYYPDAVAFDASGGPDDAAVNLKMADGSTQYVDDEISGEYDENLFFHGHANRMYMQHSDEKGWMELEQTKKVWADAHEESMSVIDKAISDFHGQRRTAVVDTSDLAEIRGPVEDHLADLKERLDDESDLGDDHIDGLGSDIKDLESAFDRIYSR